MSMAGIKNGWLNGVEKAGDFHLIDFAFAVIAERPPTGSLVLLDVSGAVRRRHLGARDGYRGPIHLNVFVIDGMDVSSTLASW